MGTQTIIVTVHFVAIECAYDFRVSTNITIKTFIKNALNCLQQLMDVGTYMEEGNITVLCDKKGVLPMDKTINSCGIVMGTELYLL